MGNDSTRRPAQVSEDEPPKPQHDFDEQRRTHFWLRSGIHSLAAMREYAATHPPVKIPGPPHPGGIR